MDTWPGNQIGSERNPEPNKPVNKLGPAIFWFAVLCVALCVAAPFVSFRHGWTIYVAGWVLVGFVSMAHAIWSLRQGRWLPAALLLLGILLIFLLFPPI